MSPIEERRAAKPPANWVRRLLWGVLIAYWLTLFTSTHAPIDPKLIVPGKDKTLHIMGYSGLGVLFGLVFGTSTLHRFAFLRALAILAIYAVFDELTQLLVGRHCDLYDWFADCGGIVIGLTAAWGLSRIVPVRDPGKSV